MVGDLAGRKRSKSHMATTQSSIHQNAFQSSRANHVRLSSSLFRPPNSLGARRNFKYPAPAVGTGIR